MPDKGINEVNRSIREQVEKGVAAINRNNFDYAISILSGVLKQEPALYPAREALRDAQFRRAALKGGFLRKMFGAASNSPLLAKAQIELRGNPLHAIQTAEQVLSTDPRSVAGHKLVAAAARALDYPKAALFSLQYAFKFSPDKETALQLSQALALAGQASKADAVLVDLVKTFPNDPEITQALKDLSARRTLKEGGYGALEDGTGSYRDILKDKAEAVSIEQAQRDIRSEDATLRLINENEARLTQEPRNTRLLRHTAELYAQERLYDRALETYQRIIDVEGMAEPSLQKQITATRLRQFADQINALDPDAPDDAETRGKIETERDAYEIERMHQLIEQYPTDLALRFEYGELLFRKNRITEAIQEFQKAQNNPHRRVQALFYLGRCFAQRGIRDLAARTIETAIREKPVFDDEKKELIYTLATVWESMGRKAEAIEQFKLIYELDIGYRDVAARVDAYYAEQSGT